jgi:hypothetical protein
MWCPHLPSFYLVTYLSIMHSRQSVHIQQKNDVGEGRKAVRLLWVNFQEFHRIGVCVVVKNGHTSNTTTSIPLKSHSLQGKVEHSRKSSLFYSVAQLRL